MGGVENWTIGVIPDAAHPLGGLLGDLLRTVGGDLVPKDPRAAHWLGGVAGQWGFAGLDTITIDQTPIAGCRAFLDVKSNDDAATLRAARLIVDALTVLGWGLVPAHDDFDNVKRWGTSPAD